MDETALKATLSARLTDLTQRPVSVSAVRPLYGGACQDNFRVELCVGDAPVERLVLRSDAHGSLPNSLGRAEEFAVIQAAVAAGVRTPAVRWLLPDLLRPGACAYLMDFVEGEAIGAKLTRDPALAAARARLPGELAEVLAAIHRLSPDRVPALSAALGPPPGPEAMVAQAIAAQRRTLLELEEPHLGLELALEWLSSNPPTGREVVLVHGDFRTGNFMVRPGGLSGVLDWEFAHWGSPFEDVAWLCVRDWRFGQLDLEAGGFCERATFYRAYEQASGRSVAPAEVRFWEVMGNVRWALGALAQGLRAVKGGEKDLELPAIARRACEMEYEALRLVERG